MLRRLPLLLPMIVLLSASVAQAQIDLRWGGRVQSDIRFRTAAVGLGGYYARTELPAGVARNENIFKLKLDAGYDRFTAVAELDFVFYGYSQQLEGIGDLSLREKVDPYRIEGQALYIEAVDLFVNGLDVRIGQQQVFWGKGDQFNPTNTINSNDIEDPLLFGEQVANMMVKVDYTPGTTWTFTGVLVPIFKPALLPDSAFIGLSAADRLPMVDSALRWRLHTEKAFTESVLGFPTVVQTAIPDLPERTAANMQWAFRVAGTLWDQDIALSYYYGRTDTPQAYLNVTRLKNDPRCDPNDATRCIRGMLETETRLGYPRMQVIGLNMAGQVNLLGWLSSKIKPIGYRVEAGLFLPQAATISLLQEEMDFGLYTQPAGEYVYHFDVSGSGRFPRPLVVDDTPFAKWVVGLDYTFNKYVYTNLQWVHGFPDEFGAGDFITEGWAVRSGGTGDLSLAAPCLFDPNPQKCLATAGEKVAVETLRPRLGDYLVLGVDIRLLSQKMLVRLFGILDLIGIYEERWDEVVGERVREHLGMFTSRGFSAVIYPEVQYNFGNGFELGAGALVMLGDTDSKFGDPATGGSQVFTRARFTW